jgi:oligoendopeptidase F
MNAAGAVRDVETMVHEAGHAFHSVLTNPLPFNGQKSFPSEVAELASMSMESITHAHWDAYFPNDEDARRAKQEHSEGIIRILPWIATVDAFNIGFIPIHRIPLPNVAKHGFAFQVVQHCYG